MTTMIRKQIYIDPQQERKLKQAAQLTGLSEAEIIRRLLAQNLTQLMSPVPSLTAWETEEAFITSLLTKGTQENGRRWTREELYER